MINYLKNKYAISDSGAKNLLKGILSCTFTNIGLMFPVGIIYLLLEECLKNDFQTNIYLDFKFYFLISLGVFFVIGVLEYIQYNNTFLTSYVESANMRIVLAEKIRKLPLSFFERKNLSDLTTRIMADCQGIETALSHYIPEFIGAIISLILVGIGLTALNLKMAMALLWVVPVSFVIMILSKLVQDRYNLKNIKLKLEQADMIQEYLENIKEIKTNLMKKEYLTKLDSKLKATEKGTINSEFLTGVFIIFSQSFLKLGIASTMLYGIKLLINKEIDLLTYIVFLIAASRIFDPLYTVFTNMSAIYATKLKANRMKEIEKFKVQIGNKKINFENLNILVKNVSFSYKSDGNRVIKNMNFIARQGEVTALVGHSGCGKTTLAKLISRFWDVDSGKIYIGENDISNIDAEKLLELFSIVFQNVNLFNNTIMENIRIGKKDASDDEVIKASKAANCHGFIMKLKYGYGTVIGENGSHLSGGERQRISIARAILKDSPIVLLDEATSSLDVDNETLVQNAISKLIKNKTVLIIAHRLRTIVNADKILVMEQGLLKEQGTHKELIKLNGVYKKMYEMQEKSSLWKI
ncbi:ABC transporter ATP-binding protein [Fusobacterium sp. MFO224]|uniref:ABC transporter ATP-binding protein n=1 Tax=Fusobacterium sp. MFO224 TaxID=3378070 RepID=UPI003852D92E